MLRRSTVCRVTTFNFGHPLMSQRFGGITLATKERQADAGVKSSVMPNGVKALSHDKDGMQTTIGFYVDAGPKFDPAAAPGLSYVLRWTLCTSNLYNSFYQVDRAIRSIGAGFEHCEVGKRFVGWKFDVRRDLATNLIPVIADCIAAPRFTETDIERFRDTMDTVREERRWQQPHLYVVDELETVAFWKEPLGNPTYVPLYSNDACTTQTLIDHWASMFQPSRVTVAGINIDHNGLLNAYANAQYSHSAAAPHHAAASKPVLGHKDEKLQYRPGSQRHEQEKRTKEMGTSPDMRYDGIAALGWLTNGREGGVKDYATSLVVRELIQSLNGGNTTPVSDNADGARSFYRPYATAGLIGVTVKGPKDSVADALKAIKLPAKDTSAADVEAAKSSAAVRHYSENLEVQRDYIDFLATSPFSVAELKSALASVTAADVKKEVESIRSLQPSLFTTGELQDMPSLYNLQLKN